uniref:Uncharacterized protein n=1 Tax=Plectus sambesii TaxID=2011161 RepID=A0A914UZS2_9BILA
MKVYEMRNSARSYNNLPSCYMLYYAGDDAKTTARTGFYISALLAFIRLHTLNYTDNDISDDDDDHDGINEENDSGVDNKTTASTHATLPTTKDVTGSGFSKSQGRGQGRGYPDPVTSLTTTTAESLRV